MLRLGFGVPRLRFGVLGSQGIKLFARRLGLTVLGSGQLEARLHTVEDGRRGEEGERLFRLLVRSEPKTLHPKTPHPQPHTNSKPHNGKRQTANGKRRTAKGKRQDAGGTWYERCQSVTSDWWRLMSAMMASSCSRVRFS